MVARHYYRDSGGTTIELTDRILREGSVCQCGKTNYAEKPTDDSHDPVTTRRVEIYPR